MDNKKKEFVSDVTEFPREGIEEDAPSRFRFESISKFFSFGRSTADTPSKTDTETSAAKQLGDLDKSDASSTDSFPNPGEEGRSLPNVLKRISNLVAGKEGATSEKNLKLYWLPDSFSNECYDCGEKFTAFRRRHHCRVCGQIFCSRCCNQRIPGKIMQYSGDLRVCTYCCKVVLSYLESSNISADLSSDLRSLQDDLHLKIGSRTDLQSSPVSSSGNDVGGKSAVTRKFSLGYQEERFVLGRAPSCTVLSDEERCQALQKSESLRTLFEEMLDTVSGVPLHTFHYQQRDIPCCVMGSGLIDWLITNCKAATRVQGLAMGQILLEAGYLEATSDMCFTDSDSRYCVITNVLCPPMLSPQSPWGTHSDSASELASEGEDGLRQSVSSYQLDMDVSERVVHLARPSSPPGSEEPSEETKKKPEKKISIAQEAELDASVFLDTPPGTSNDELGGNKTGWHHADHLVRPEHEEADSYFRLISSFSDHVAGLLNQLLTSEGLSLTWSPIIAPIAQSVVDNVRVDHRVPNAEMDIRKYVQIKKLPGGNRQGIKVIPGVVFSKNVAHRAMKTRIDNARILILKCAIVYQRVEGRMLSLEPVMMQEHEYLRHVVARIASLKPHVIFVHRNVSRLAQDYLLDLGITLVLNVKESILNRISRMTGAEVIKSIDATVSQSQLGTCTSFFLETFQLNDGSKKTLMFIEGNPETRCTVLLRGGSNSELKKLKKITSFIILAEYNWRFEKSFLMDEFARPPSPPKQLFQDSPTCSLAERLTEQKSPGERRLTTTSVSSIESIALDSDQQVVSNETEGELKVTKDNSEIDKPKDLMKSNATVSIACESDPLQAEPFDPLQVKWEAPLETVRLSVAEMPQKNKFRTALDETILSISPCLKLGIPYLESDLGQKCALRPFFPKELFTSKHFNEQKTESKNITRKESFTSSNIFDIGRKHDFLTTKFVDDANSIEVQTLLALYRANGGQIPFGTKGIPIKRKSTVQSAQPASKDVFDPFEHQFFSVLFCCYSSQSANAPAFCVDPWVVTMRSYGREDIPLGWFLEFYCFRPSAPCRSQTCQLPLNYHMRRFVHESGALCLSVSPLPRKLDPEDIWMWTWCSVCKVSSQRVAMSADTWSLSFAKYLELRFLAESYTRRGPDGCRHSLHHQHVQYFAQSGLAATFVFMPISVKWEISLPPLSITLTSICNPQECVDELRSIAIKGHDVFSTIVSYFMGMEHLTEEELLSIKTQQQKDQVLFKQKIEEIQIRLTSPTLGSRRFDPGEVAKNGDPLWRVEDAIAGLKRYIAETVVSWNSRLTDCRRKEDRTKRFSDGNVKPQVSTPPSEDGRSKDEDDKFSTGNETEEEAVWEKPNEPMTDTGDSEDNVSLASHQEETRSSDDVRDHLTDSKSDKKSVKTILSQILTTSKDASPIQSPWSPLEHYLLPPGVNVTVVVTETEPSSVIAYALASHDHNRHLEEKKKSGLTVPPPALSGNVPSPLIKRKTLSSSSSADKEHQGDPMTSPNHCEVLFGDATCSFSCLIYHAEDFANFRNLVLPSGQEAYIRSLMHCATWAAKGGKSGSAFSKTKDDRFVIKQMQKIELTLFLEFAPQYLSYVTRCHEEQSPTLLGKILGVYTITSRHPNRTTQHTNLLVMENLFYQRSVTHKYDLKGSVRNRMVNPVGSRDSEIVYMDENLLKMTCDSPLYMMHHSQSILMRAIESDTEFLANQHVMDYSLLVGLDENRSELVVGIIDYIRRFTWDKRLENMVKTSVIGIGNNARQPTIIEPKDYRVRFIAAMKRYFLPVPDRWYGFGNSS